VSVDSNPGVFLDPEKTFSFCQAEELLTASKRPSRWLLYQRKPRSAGAKSDRACKRCNCLNKLNSPTRRITIPIGSTVISSPLESFSLKVLLASLCRHKT
jgi:hypothetical protein